MSPNPGVHPLSDGVGRRKRVIGGCPRKPIVLAIRATTAETTTCTCQETLVTGNDLSHHNARYPSHLSYTPELCGSHTAVAVPMSSAVECYGSYKLTGPATIVKASGSRSGNTMAAYLGPGASLELYTGDSIVVMKNEVSGHK